MTPLTVPTILILNVGQDAALLDSRGLLLRSAGYIIESTCSIEDAIRRLRAGDFDLVVLCDSIPTEERQRLIRQIRNYGSAIPVVFTSAASAPYPERSADVSIGSDPREFLRGVHEVLEKASFAHR